MKQFLFILQFVILYFSHQAKAGCLVHSLKELNDGSLIGKSTPISIDNPRECCLQGYNSLGNLCSNDQVIKFSRTCTNENGLTLLSTAQATCNVKPIAQISELDVRNTSSISKNVKSKCSTQFSSRIADENVSLFKNSVKVRSIDDCKKLAVSKAKVMCISQRVGNSILARSQFSGNSISFSIPCSKKVANRTE